MARSSRRCSSTAVDPTTRASSSTLRLLLLLLGVAAFSVPTPSSFFEYRLVDHVDRLQQRRQTEPGGSDPAPPATAIELVPPPHLFRLTAPGGDVCLIVDENGAYHAVRDTFPPLGFPVSETGVVDTQVLTLTYGSATCARTYLHVPTTPRDCSLVIPPTVVSNVTAVV